MDGKQLIAEIGERYNLPPSRVSLRKQLNRAIRTLPGGPELLDSIESQNAARIHAERHNATDRVVAIDHAIDALEKIRDAMVRHVVEGVGGNR